MTQKWHRYLGLTLLLLFVVVPHISRAAVSVRPVLIDQVIEPRALFTEEITVTNPTNRRLSVYATVNEIALDAGGEIRTFIPPGDTDRSSTVTSWLEITRGRIDIPPGESVTVPLTVRVHHEVVPGTYQAFIGFVPASKRYQAEAVALAGEAVGSVVRLEMPDQRREAVRISRFVIERLVSGLGEAEAIVTIENIGDIAVVPGGDVVFYDSRGREVTALPLNADAARVQPQDTLTFNLALPSDFALGRYKANLRLMYGATQRAQLMDTTFFVVFPWQIVLGFLLGLLALVSGLVWWWRRTTPAAGLSDELDDVRLYVNPASSRNDTEHDINLKH